ncbi:hypothetical protein L210DRAFT_3545673 [Boletus edulis BED1]|uniref:Uncharacterized protein n=1 Tax=Boletus edulis BED1 TaxID=1328754 RepID=A0AAD4BRR8_BOLED|nr:hypothetical protein L210DRAFT_3545673 [Boletus edulis BED1]
MNSHLGVSLTNEMESLVPRPSNPITQTAVTVVPSVSQSHLQRTSRTGMTTSFSASAVLVVTPEEQLKAKVSRKNVCSRQTGD